MGLLITRVMMLSSPCRNVLMLLRCAHSPLLGPCLLTQKCINYWAPVWEHSQLSMFWRWCRLRNFKFQPSKFLFHANLSEICISPDLIGWFTTLFEEADLYKFRRSDLVCGGEGVTIYGGYTLLHGHSTTRLVFDMQPFGVLFTRRRPCTTNFLAPRPIAFLCVREKSRKCVW